MVKILFCIVAIFIVFLMGFLCGSHKLKNTLPFHGGNIFIDAADPTKDTIRIELEIPIGEMLTKEYITFQVINEGEPDS